MEFLVAEYDHRSSYDSRLLWWFHNGDTTTSDHCNCSLILDQLHFGPLDIVGPLPKTSQSNQYIQIRNNHNLKLSRAILSSETNEAPIANLIFDQYILQFGFLTYLFTENCFNLFREVFASVCVYLGVKYLTAAVYHSLTNGEAKWFIRKIVTYLRRYVAYHHWE